MPFKDEKVYYKTEEPAAHNSIADDLMSGEITYEIESKTPVLSMMGRKGIIFIKMPGENTVFLEVRSEA